MTPFKGFALLSSVLIALTASGCCEICQVTPPSKVTTDRSVVVKAAADLSKIASLPVNVNLDVEVKNTVDAAFQNIPDADVKCEMLLQLSACMVDHGKIEQAAALASETMKTGNACAGQMKDLAKRTEALANSNKLRGMLQ